MEKFTAPLDKFTPPSFARTSAILQPSDAYLTRLGQVKAPGQGGMFARTSLSRLSTDSKDAKAAAAEEGGTERLLNDYVHAQACWAAQLVLDLTKAESTMDRLNPAVLNSCEALAFVHTVKGGAVLSLASGYGFVIKKTNQDQYGNSSWGQPLFFTVSQAGLGLSAGYQSSQSVIAVLALGALDVFKVGTRSMGTDLGLFSTDGALTGIGGAAMGGSVHLGMTVDQDRAAFCYSKVDGLYLELSMHGSSVSPDKEANAALYGQGYDADAVLNEIKGKYAQDLKPLLKVINELGQKAVRG